MKEPYVAVEANVLLKADSDEEKEITKWIFQKIEEEGKTVKSEEKTCD